MSDRAATEASRADDGYPSSVCGLREGAVPAARSAVCERTECGLTLLELIVAITISGLVSVAALFAFRIGVQAWQKGQKTAIELRRATSAEDIVQIQLSNQVTLKAKVQLPDRNMEMPFFFGAHDRLVFVTSYSARQRGRGGLVVADYFAEQQPDQTWKLWLDEEPVTGEWQLGYWVAALAPDEQQIERPVLRPFDRENALLLWEGLSVCRFFYWHPSLEQSEWWLKWPPDGTRVTPPAIAVDLASVPGRDRMPAVPVFVSMNKIAEAQ